MSNNNKEDDNYEYQFWTHDELRAEIATLRAENKELQYEIRRLENENEYLRETRTVRRNLPDVF